MSYPLLVNSTDIKLWADQRVSQQLIPQLLRRLILATAKEDVTTIDFPAHESVQMGGWDGTVTTVSNHTFVPKGESVWEIGTNKAVKGKADEDYKKRAANPLGKEQLNTTYIFVTPRRWGGKGPWKKTKQKEGIWKEVRAYDADDLETWLEMAPSVHLWFSDLLGKDVHSLTSLETFWNEWRQETDPVLTSDLVLGGRDEISSKILQFLNNPSSTLSIGADTIEEAVAFVAASFSSQIETGLEFFSRAILVRDEAAWRVVVQSNSGLILIPMFENIQ